MFASKSPSSSGRFLPTSCFDASHNDTIWSATAVLSPFVPVICDDRLPATSTRRGGNVAAWPIGTVGVVPAGGSLGIDASYRVEAHDATVTSDARTPNRAAQVAARLTR